MVLDESDLGWHQYPATTLGIMPASVHVAISRVRTASALVRIKTSAEMSWDPEYSDWTFGDHNLILLTKVLSVVCRIIPRIDANGRREIDESAQTILRIVGSTSGAELFSSSLYRGDDRNSSSIIHGSRPVIAIRLPNNASRIPFVVCIYYTSFVGIAFTEHPRARRCSSVLMSSTTFERLTETIVSSSRQHNATGD